MPSYTVWSSPPHPRTYITPKFSSASGIVLLEDSKAAVKQCTAFSLASLCSFVTPTAMACGSGGNSDAVSSALLSASDAVSLDFIASLTAMTPKLFSAQLSCFKAATDNTSTAPGDKSMEA